MSEECRHSKISSQDFVTCEGCGFKVKDILAALQSSLDTATDEIAVLRAEKAALEKVAEAAQKLSIYHPNFFELHDALREAGYLGGGDE